MKHILFAYDPLCLLLYHKQTVFEESRQNFYFIKHFLFVNNGLNVTPFPESIKGHHCFIAQSFEAIFPIIANPIKVESDSPQSDSSSYIEPESATKAVLVIFV